MDQIFRDFRLYYLCLVKHRSSSVAPASVTFDFCTVLTFGLIMQRYGNTYIYDLYDYNCLFCCYIKVIIVLKKLGSII